MNSKVSSLENDLPIEQIRLKKKVNAGRLLTKYGVYIAFLCLVIVLSISSNAFFTVNNVLNILTQVSVIGIISVGMTFVILTSGIDLSVGAVVALTSVIVGGFAQTGASYPLIVPIIIGMLAGVVCGFVNGFTIAKWNVAPFIVTLGMMTAARGLALVISNGKPVINLSNSFLTIGGGNLLGIPIPVLVFLIVIIIGAFLLNYTRLGRYIYATGGNEQAANFSGLNTTFLKVLVYSIAGLTAGIASIVLTSRVMTGSPVLGEGYELDAIAAVVIGGTSLFGGIGSIYGTVIGVLMIGVLNNGLDLLNVSSYYQQILKGVIIVLAVLLDRKKNH